MLAQLKWFLPILASLIFSVNEALGQNNVVPLMPANGMMIPSDVPPRFIWKKSKQAPVGSFYHIRVFKGKPGTSDTRFYFPLFDKELQEASYFDWPANADQPIAGESYSWSIRILDKRRNPIDEGWTEPQVFHIETRTPSPKEVIPIGVNVSATGTGNSTGQIGIVSLNNSSNQTVRIQLGPAVIPSTKNSQGYFVPEYREIELQPNENRSIDLHGYCMDVELPPLSYGTGMAAYKDWQIISPFRIEQGSNSQLRKTEQLYQRFWSYNSVYAYGRIEYLFGSPFDQHLLKERSIFLQQLIWLEISRQANEKSYDLNDFQSAIFGQEGYKDWASNRKNKKQLAKMESERLWRNLLTGKEIADELCSSNRPFSELYKKELANLITQSRNGQHPSLTNWKDNGEQLWSEDLWTRIALDGPVFKLKERNKISAWYYIGAAGVGVGAAAIASQISSGDCNPDLINQALEGDKLLCDGTAQIGIIEPCLNCDYQWTHGPTGSQLTVNDVGNYVLMVSDDNGCVQELPAWSVEDEEQASLSLSIEGPTYICPSFETVSVFATTCSNCSLLLNGQEVASPVHLSSAGNYEFTSRNRCGQQTQEIVVIKEYAFQTEILGNTFLCTNTTNELTALIIDGPQDEEFSYQWNGLSGNPSITISDPGEYQLEIGNGYCSSSSNVIIEEVAFPELLLEGTTELCSGESVKLLVEGNCDDCIYQWSNGQNSSEITITEAGNYSVSVSNDSDCLWSSEIVVNDAPSLNLELIGSSTLCPSESIDLLVQGDCDDCLFTWSTGSHTASTTVDAVGLVSVSVQSPAGCFWEAEQAITQAHLPAITLVGNTEICEGGSTQLSIEGDCPSCTYLWSNGANTNSAELTESGEVFVIVSDETACNWIFSENLVEGTMLDLSIQGSLILCNSSSGLLTVAGACESCEYSWSTGDTGAELPIASPGQYSVSVENQTGCSWNGSVTVEMVEEFEFDITGPTTVCAGETASLTLNTACPGCSFNWSSGETTNSISVTQSGNYELSLSNNVDCFWTGNYEVIFDEEITADIELSAIDCLDGPITLSLLTNCDDCTIEWSNNTNDPAITVNESGTYTVELLNTNDCMATTAVDVVSQSDMTVQTTTVPPNCVGSNGEIHVAILPDPSLYTITWFDNTNGSSQLNLAAGIFDYTITNNQIGCGLTQFVPLVAEELVLEAEVIDMPPSSEAAGDGFIELILLNSTSPPFEVNVNGFVFEAQSNPINIVGLPYGLYTIAIMDNNSCSSEEIVVEWIGGGKAPASALGQTNSTIRLSLKETYNRLGNDLIGDDNHLGSHQTLGLHYNRELPMGWQIQGGFSTYLPKKNQTSLSLPLESSIGIGHSIGSSLQLFGGISYLFTNRETAIVPFLAFQWSMNKRIDLIFDFEPIRKETAIKQKGLLELQLRLRP